MIDIRPIEIVLKKVFLIILLVFSLSGFCQVKRIGTPNILNYPKSVYKAGTQNWNIAQDPNGFMYFANNDGLLRFDGLTWELFRVSSTPPVRSVCVDKSGTIYVGMDNDFGIFDTEEPGSPVFKSFRDKIPEDIEETDIIWKIYDTQYGIVFQTHQYIFIYRDEKIQVIRPKKAFSYSFYVNNRLFFHEPGVGLFELINGFVNKVPWADELVDTEILSIVSFYENQLLIGTAHDGWFEYKRGKLEIWDTPANRQIEKDILFNAVKLQGNNLAIGSILNGVIVVNSDGMILQHLNRSKGLQNNTVLSLYNDQSGNLWLGLDNGVDFVELNSPLSYISGAEGISTGYCSVVYESTLYLGTNQGLFARPFSINGYNENQKFSLVPGTEGQVWSLKIIEGQLICGHHLGAFIIDGYKAKRISYEAGGWTFRRLVNDKQYMIGGDYTGFSVYKLIGGEWQFQNKVKGFSESSRFLTQDKNGNFWVSHGSKGIFRVRLNELKDSAVDVKRYGVDEGLPSDDMNVLLSIGDSWFISTIDGIYTYDAGNDRFVRDVELNEMFDFEGRLKFVTLDNQGSIWYIAESGVGVMHKNEDQSYTPIVTPFKQLTNSLVREWEFLYVLDNDNVFIATESGFAHYSSRVVTSLDIPFRSFITRVDVPYLDTVVYVTERDQYIEFPFTKNAFRFHFAAPFYQNPEQLEFSYFVENYSERWSPWSGDNYRDLTNLPENEYVFRVKARNSFDQISEESEFLFVIKPPWYRSKTATYGYVVISLLIGLIVAWFINRRFEKSKQKERKKHEKVMRKKEKEFEQQSILAEKEIIRLKNEKLEAEKLSLDKELANQTLSIVNKNKFLIKITGELKRVSEETTDSSVKSRMAILQKRIDREIDNQHQKKIFESYFEEVHAEFFDRLKDQYPQLSPKDLRLCAYIRMNMSTKEIATLLAISERGVEISRYRLRKKLDLSREINLSTFLLNF